MSGSFLRFWTALWYLLLHLDGDQPHLKQLKQRRLASKTKQPEPIDPKVAIHPAPAVQNSTLSDLQGSSVVGGWDCRAGHLLPAAEEELIFILGSLQRSASVGFAGGVGGGAGVVAG